MIFENENKLLLDQSFNNLREDQEKIAPFKLVSKDTMPQSQTELNPSIGNSKRTNNSPIQPGSKFEERSDQMAVIGEEPIDQNRSDILESDANSQSSIHMKGSIGSQKSINSYEESPIGYNRNVDNAEDTRERLNEQDEIQLRARDSTLMRQQNLSPSMSNNQGIFMTSSKKQSI